MIGHRFRNCPSASGFYDLTCPAIHGLGDPFISVAQEAAGMGQVLYVACRFRTAVSNLKAPYVHCKFFQLRPVPSRDECKCSPPGVQRCIARSMASGQLSEDGTDEAIADQGLF